MDAEEAMLTLRSMRRYRPDPVDVADIEACLKCAVQAPSGGNIQPWQFVVITEQAVKDELGVLYRRCYERYEKAMLPTVRPPRTDEDRKAWERTTAAAHHLSDHFAASPVIVAFCVADIDLTLTDADGPLDIGSVLGSVFPAVQNFMLAARARGLGSSLTTVHRIEQQATRDILAIPATLQIVALVPVGYPVGKFGVARRKPAHIVTHWNRFGAKREF